MERRQGGPWQRVQLGGNNQHDVRGGEPQGLQQRGVELRHLDKGVPLDIKVKVTIAGSDMTIDLSGCSKERKAGINSRTLAGARVAYKALTGPLEPTNQWYAVAKIAGIKLCEAYRRQHGADDRFQNVGGGDHTFEGAVFVIDQTNVDRRCP